MFVRMIVSFLLLTVLTIAAKAEIREIKSMQEILPSIDRETLVIFDLDNTIMEAVQTLGSDQWFSYQVKRFREQGMPAGDAVEKAAEMWARVQRVTRVRPVETVTPELIRALQTRGITVMGLTARSRPLMARTREELADIGVDLDRTPLLTATQAPLLGGKAMYDHGIIFAGSAEKGPTLTAIFTEQGLLPHKVVFVDDKAHHTQTVDAALTAAAIPGVEFRYGAADPQVQAFDPKLGDFQWNHFERTGALLSDSLARRLMAGSVPPAGRIDPVGVTTPIP